MADEVDAASVADEPEPSPENDDARAASSASADRWPWTWHLVVVTFALRFFAVAGIKLFLYFDSAEYDVLDFSGRWRRPWTVPLLYSWLPDDWGAPTVVVQALIGAACWSVLALVLVGFFSDRRVQMGVAVTVVALSLTTTVTNWDTAKLSESLSISLTVLLVAAWLDLLRRTSWLGVAQIVAVTLPWLFIRQSVMPTAWALGLLSVALAVAAIVVDRRSSDRARMFTVLAVVLIGLNAWATVSYARNQEIVNTNLTAVVAYRIGPDTERLDWFVDHGMPIPKGEGTDFTSLDQDPAFRRWVADDGGSVYARFLATHPWYAATAPIRDLFTERTSWLNLPPLADKPEIRTPSMLAPGDAYGSARPVLPSSAESLLLDPGNTGSIAMVLVIAAVWGLEDWRRRRTVDGENGESDIRTRIVLGIVVLSGLMFWSAWHGATTELPRLGLVPALTLRIALVLYLGVLCERWFLRSEHQRIGGPWRRTAQARSYRRTG